MDGRNIAVLTKRLIPSLLLRNGRLVKGKQCKDYRDAGNPATTIRALCAQGADEIILLDISEDAPNLGILEACADGCTVPLTFGGGIRTVESAREAFRRGADKVFLPYPTKEALARVLSQLWGFQAIVLGVDVSHRAELPEWDGEIRLLDVAHEGTRQGMDADLIRWAAQAKTPLIAEGGAGNLNHIAQAFKAGADAVALGAMLTFTDANLVKIKRHLKAEGFAMRV
jgi:cyclase